MRKVIYKEWVRGIETEEYKQWKKAGGPTPCPQLHVEGTNCYIEKEGLFHGFFPTAMENNDGSFGNFTEALIEIEDGSVVNADPSLIRFIDKPETAEDANGYTTTYLRVEQEQAYERMEALGINIHAHTFEQCVNDLLYRLEKNTQ